MALQYMLDTNICIYIAKNQPKAVAQHFAKLSVGQVCMSVITYGELLFGAENSQRSKHSKLILEKYASLIEPIPLPVAASEEYARTRAALLKQGKIIGNNDLWIAAHCLALDLTLVTNNTKEFARVKNLKIENWVH